VLTDKQRTTYEQRLADAFMGAVSAHGLFMLLGQPPDVRNVPAAYWDALDAQMLAALEPIITEMAKASALGLGGQSGILEQVNWTLANTRAADWAGSYTYDLVAGIDATTQARLGQLVSAYYKTPGQDLQGLAGQIGEMFGPARAEMIAVTETTRAAAEGEQTLVDEIRAANPDVNVVGIFLTSRDEWVCQKICAPLNGVRDDGQGNFVNPLDGETYRIPTHPRCLPGDSLVSAVGGIAAASKRFYEGDMVVIRTASGNQLACTPNHPVLTYGGWVAAGALDEFSYVVSRRGREWETFVNDDSQNMPTRIEDIAEAFGRARGVLAAEVKTTAPDFDGDGAGSEVAVIWTDGLLRNRFDAAFGQKFGEHALGRRDVQLPGLDGSGTFDIFRQSWYSADGSLMSGGNLRGAALRRHLRPFERLGSARVAWGDAGLEQVAANDATSDFEGVGQRFLGFAGQVTARDNIGGQRVDRLSFGRLGMPHDHPGFFQASVDDGGQDAQLARQLIAGAAGPVFADQVVSVERDSFHGFVYNLETTTGAYVADGIVTHNCRCTRGTLIADLPNPAGV
jgi:hypothetical protein